MQAGLPVANFASGNRAAAIIAAPAPIMIRFNRLAENRFLKIPRSRRNPSIMVKKAYMGLSTDPWFQATCSSRASSHLKSMAITTIRMMEMKLRVVLQTNESQKKANPVRTAPVKSVAHFCKPSPKANSVSPHIEPVATTIPRFHLIPFLSITLISLIYKYTVLIDFRSPI